MRLDGATALVTGGGKRVGRAIVLGLAQRDVRVAVHYHGSAAGSADVVAEIERGGGKAYAIQADLRDPGAAEQLVRASAERLGGLDILVNSAAIMLRTPIDE